MIIKNINKYYDRIRLLIGLYYDGKTTSEQEKELFDFFEERNTATMPEDLREHADVFRTLNTLNTPFPNKKFLETIEKSVKRENRVQRITSGKFGYIVSGIAACFLVAVIVSLLFTRNDINEDQNIRLIASRDTIVNRNDSLAIVTDKLVTAKTVKKSSAQKYSKNIITNQNTSDGFTVITDPEQAEAILMKIDKIFNKTIDNALSKGLENKDNLQNIDHILDNSLNKI